MVAIDWDHWEVEFHSGIPVYRQIVNRICSALAAGQLQPGDRLPTIRHLHQQLGINPNTVAKAYRELELKGVLVAERGNGSFVRADPTPPRLDEEERQARLDSFYQRVLTEAAGCGLTENELVKFIQKRRKHECNHREG
jgi:GntR family transcriptional regulator